MLRSNVVGNRLLAIIAFVLAVAALKASYPVTLPLAAAALVVAAAWPIKPWLDRKLPPALSTAGTILVLVLIVVSFVLAVYFSLSRVFLAFVERQDQLRGLYEGYAGWAGERGLPMAGGEGRSGQQIFGLARAVLASVYDVLTYGTLVAVLVIFTIPAVPGLRDKVRERLQESERHELLGTVGEIADKVRSYLWTMTVTSLITGVASWLFALAVGLDLALVWGVLNFLLNYIPLVGNVVGIVPPTLYALIQFQGWQMPLLVFVGYAVLQVGISNVVEPLLQGRSLSLSPVAVLVALSFWAWMWGIAGALLAVPLTAAIIIVCQHFRSTEWIALLLSDKRGRGPVTTLRARTHLLKGGGRDRQDRSKP